MAIVLSVAATATATAQLQPAPQTAGTLAVVEDVTPAEGRLRADDGRVFLVTDRTVLEVGANTIQGLDALEALQSGMALRIASEPDSDPPRIERMRVETR